MHFYFILLLYNCRYARASKTPLARRWKPSASCQRSWTLEALTHDAICLNPSETVSLRPKIFIYLHANKSVLFFPKMFCS